MNTLDATLDNATTSSTTPKESANSIKKTSKADSSGSTTRSNTTHLLPANTSVSDDDLYEFEKIVDKMIGKDGKPEYRIRWMGCNKDQDTWEPPENLPEKLIRMYDEVVSQNGNKGPTSL